MDSLIITFFTYICRLAEENKTNTYRSNSIVEYQPSLPDMKSLSFVLLAVLLCIVSASATAQWKPSIGWKDSYAVNGVCYCDSSNYDHNLDEKTAETPIGRLNVVQICEDIKAAIGFGSANGRIPYNDIQCGNGPANDAADEAGCPGRVDIGSAGCNVIGPKWDLEAVYGDSNDDNTRTYVTGTTASPNGGDARFALDGNTNTRWTTKQSQRPGQVFQLDLGSRQTIGKVILDSKRNSGDEPDAYSLSISTNGRNYQVVATGSGNNGITEIDFTERLARYVRITQTGSKSRNWWSIHEVIVSR